MPYYRVPGEEGAPIDPTVTSYTVELYLVICLKCANVSCRLYFIQSISHFFCSGNLGRVDYISDFEYDLFIRPDTCNPRYRVWFHFTVENVAAGQVNLCHAVPQMPHTRQGIQTCNAKPPP